jgi:hypothetical protein
MPVFKDFILTGQAEGFSIIDNVIRPDRTHGVEG